MSRDVELPCGCVIEVEHTMGEHLKICAAHQRAYKVRAREVRTVEYSVTETRQPHSH